MSKPDFVSDRETTWAIFVAPHVGGIYSFFRVFHGLLGARLCSVELEGEEQRWRGHDPALALPGHHVLALDGATGAAASRRVADWLVGRGISVVVVTPMTPAPVFDALPHLPRHIRVLSRMTEVSSHSYRLGLRNAQAIDGVIVQCSLQSIQIAALVPDMPLHPLPNAVDTVRFAPRPDAPGFDAPPFDPLRLLVMDRLVDVQKRVLLLPRLCRDLDALGLDYRLSVAGDGPDAGKLAQDLRPWVENGRVRLLGMVEGTAVPQLLRDHDLYLKLSRNEGSPNAVLEAMASGLATVAFAIPGVMDDVLTSGETGVIVAQGDIAAMARAIGSMDRDRAGLQRMGSAARADATGRFSRQSLAARLAQIEGALPEHSRRVPLPWEAWRESHPARGSVRNRVTRLLPLSLRVRLREIMGLR